MRTMIGRKGQRAARHHGGEFDRRRRPGYFRVTRPDELWHLDMTKVWTAAQGWVYLEVAAILGAGLFLVPLFFSALDAGFGQ